MKPEILRVSVRYRTALRQHLLSGRPASPDSARGLGTQALAAGMQTLDLAKLHEQTLVTEVLPQRPAGQRAMLIKRAGAFFAVAISPIEKEQRGTRQANAQFQKFLATLSQRTVELAASNVALNLEVAQRKAAEDALSRSARHYSLLLQKSQHLQDQLRRLSRQILAAQEEERKKISRELHDVIAQTLTGINIRLATLKKESASNRAGLDRNIALTQRLVERSVRIVHQFARQLRPAMLDDLGLVPALHSFLKHFTAQTGVRSHLTTFDGVEGLDSAKKTALYRVAQEAITNTGRHARASHVKVTLERLPNRVLLKIADNGKSFPVHAVLQSSISNHLGLLGMRERIEMLRGTFEVESTPGKGTTVRAELPFPNANRHRGRAASPKAAKVRQRQS